MIDRPQEGRSKLPRKRKSMRKIQEILRLHFEQKLGQRQIITWTSSLFGSIADGLPTGANSSTAWRSRRSPLTQCPTSPWSNALQWAKRPQTATTTCRGHLSEVNIHLDGSALPIGSHRIGAQYN
jgi:hypothetical protein